MAFPKLLQKLFQNSGAGSLLREDIIPIDSSLSTTSTNAVQNKVVKSALDAKLNTSAVDSALSTTSTNPVQNKVINTALGTKLNTADLNTALTELITEYGGTVPS